MFSFGTDDQRQIYTLNSAGYTIQTETDVTNDGSIDKVSTYTLNEKGKILQKLDYNRSYDTQGVATDTLTQKEVYSVDSNGYTVGMTRYMGSSTQPIVIESYEVDALGQRTKALIDNYGDNIIDRAEIYTLDVNGYRMKTETDVGNTGTIDSNITYTRDALGRELEQSTDADNDGNIDSRTTYELDVYGNALVSKMYNGSSDTPNGVYTRTFNSLNQVDTLVFDRTGNGLSSDDTTYTYTYDEQGRREAEVRYRTQTGEKLSTISYEYGDDSLVLKRTEDWDGSGVIDSSRDRIYSFTYDPVWLYDLTETATDGTGTPIHTLYIERNDAGQVIRTLTDTKSTGSIDRLNFGSMSGDYTVNHQEDFTQWSSERFTQMKGLNLITLSNTRYQTEITLDQAVIGKLSPAGTVAGKTSSLRIDGDATDTVNLEGNGFTKLETTQTIGSNTFDMYATTVNNTTYTLFIDNDVNTVLG